MSSVPFVSWGLDDSALLTDAMRTCSETLDLKEDSTRSVCLTRSRYERWLTLTRVARYM